MAEKKEKKKDKPVAKNPMSYAGHWLVALLLLIFVVFLIISKVNQSCPQVPECEICPDCAVCSNDCTLCPPVIQEKEVAVVEYKYVCKDDTIVNSLDECEPADTTEEEPGPPPPIDVEPITTNEEGTFITEVLVNPSCINRLVGGAITFDQMTPAPTVVFQVKDVLAGGEYEDVATYSNVKKANKEFVICDDCFHTADFKLDTGTVYFFRLKVDRTEFYDRIEYSNEHVIDTRPGSKYLKTCQ